MHIQFYTYLKSSLQKGYCLFCPTTGYGKSEYGQYDFWKDYSIDYTAKGWYSTVSIPSAGKLHTIGFFTNATLQELYVQHVKHLLQSHQTKNINSPFFLYLSFQSIHSPIQCPQQFRSQFRWVKDTARATILGMEQVSDPCCVFIKLAKFTNSTFRQVWYLLWI